VWEVVVETVGDAPPHPPLICFLDFLLFFDLFILRILLLLRILLFFVFPKTFKKENMDFNDFTIYT